MASCRLYFPFCVSQKPSESWLEYFNNRSLPPRAAQKHSSAASPAIQFAEQLCNRFTFRNLGESNLPNNLRSFSLMLQKCTSKGSILNGKAIHSRLIRTAVELDTHLLDCLINMYVKSGRLSCARNVFERMPHRDVVSWTTLIAGYSRGNNRECLILLCEMQREGILPNEFALSVGLKGCSRCLNLDFGQQLHGQATKMQLLSDLFVGSGLVDLYVKCGEIEQAEKVFLSLPQSNIVTLNSMLSGYARNGYESKVIKLFQQIEHPKVRLNKFTLSIVLKCCASLGDSRKGRILHSLSIKIGQELDGVLASNLIEIYAKSGCSDDAFKIFHRTKDADVVIWTSMITYLDKQGLSNEAIELFREMCMMGIKPNQFTLASLANAASEFGNWGVSASVHAQTIKSGFDMNHIVGNAVLDMYMRSGAVQDGCFFFDTMEEHDIVSWNTLLSGYHSGNYCKEGLRIFCQMLIENLMPNKFSFISVLRSCTSLMEVSFGSQVHSQICKMNLEENCFVETALVDMYASCGHLNRAYLVFGRMKQHDAFTWTVIISGLVKEDRGENAIKCYRQMLQEGIRPNEFTIASCLRACSELASLNNGQQLHSFTIKSGLSNAFVTSSLVDMYVKCGCLDEGEMIFAASTTHDVVSWNAMICGYSQHGYANMALMSFKHMLDEGGRPDHVTFVGVLSACRHAGLIEEGKHHFKSLSQVYGISPTIEHYACMISILGRTGAFDELKRLIDDMEITPDSSIWQIVLAACTIHKNVEIGRRSAKNLFKFVPQMDSGYVLLSRIYAQLEMWTDVVMVRTTMTSRGVKKEPGCSWIQVNGKVHVFLAQDSCHPNFEELYLMLNNLTQALMHSCDI